MSNLNLKTTIINKDNFEEKLFELLSCLDADLVGENGPEFVSKEALDNGFNSDLDYYINKALKENNNLKDIIESVLTQSSIFWNNYYDDTKISCLELEDQLFVSVAVLDR